jgi:hypothetical protein
VHFNVFQVIWWQCYITLSVNDAVSQYAEMFVLD